MKKISTNLLPALLITLFVVFAFIQATEHTGVVTMADFIKYKIEQKMKPKPNAGFPDEAMKW